MKNIKSRLMDNKMGKKIERDLERQTNQIDTTEDVAENRKSVTTEKRKQWQVRGMARNESAAKKNKDKK